MAGSGKHKGQQELKNKAMLVVRNITKQEVTNVIFPNGITVGADGAKFKNGMRIHGNAQVSGVVNAQGFKVNGEDLVASGEPFLFLDIDSPAISFDNDADRTPDPTSVSISITQSGQETTVQASDVSAQDVDGGPLTSNITGFSVTETSVGNSFSTATLDLSTGTAQNPAKYPITVSVTNGGRTSTKKIAAAVGGEDGDPGDDGYSVILSNPAHTLFTTNAGAVTYTGSGTNISVFKGSSELNGITSGTPSAGEFSVTSVSASGITEGSRNSPGNPIICGDSENMTQNTASIIYTLNIENVVSVQAVQSLTKSLQGDDAKSVSLKASSTQIVYDSSGANPSPSSITLTADSQNFSDGYFKFTGGGSAFTDETLYTDGATANQDTATFTPPSSYSATPYTMTVGVAEASQSEVASDILSISSIKQQANATRTEELSIDLHQTFLSNLRSNYEGHYSVQSTGFNTTSGPPAAGIIKNSLIFDDSISIGSYPDTTVDNTLTTGLSQADYNGLPFYRVPVGSTLTITRMIGFLSIAGVSSLDVELTLHVYRTSEDDNGTTDQKLTRLGQIKINGSASSFPVRPGVSGGYVLDTGAITAAVSAGHGVALFVHIDTVTSAGTITQCDGTLTMEYTLS